ncbi:MAG TPA: mobilization protein MbpA [Eudoraea sp.]|nr:mobilization protein MbpA [Eudoraea sp.]
MKRQFVQFRCTVFEKKLLKVKARKSGLTISEYCRRAAFDDRIIERLTEEQIEVYKMLVKYENDFKRIGNMFRKRNPKLADEVVQLANEIRQHLFNFKT